LKIYAVIWAVPGHMYHTNYTIVRRKNKQNIEKVEKGIKTNKKWI
jgi:hypothetical protein